MSRRHRQQALTEYVEAWAEIERHARRVREAINIVGDPLGLAHSIGTILGEPSGQSRTSDATDAVLRFAMTTDAEFTRPQAAESTGLSYYSVVSALKRLHENHMVVRRWESGAWLYRRTTKAAEAKEARIVAEIVESTVAE